MARPAHAVVHRYIEVACRVTVPDLPVLKGVVIHEAEDGNVEHGAVQSLVSRQWVEDDAGFRSADFDSFLPWARDCNAASDAGRLYCGWTKLIFFRVGDRVAVRGHFGPYVRFRMVGRFVVDGGEPTFTEVRLPDDSFAFNLSCPVREELELRPPRSGGS